jgi:hypothetical protein
MPHYDMRELEKIRNEMNALSTEKLVSILRKGGSDRWPPEVLDVVAAILRDRGASVDAEPLGSEEVDVADTQPLETVARFLNPAAAHAFRMALEQFGIPAWITDERLGGMYSVVIGNRIWVRASDHAAARELLASEHVSSESLPAEIAEPPCPRCQSKRTSQKIDSTDDKAAQGHIALLRKWRCVCAACGYEWSDDEA